MYVSISLVFLFVGGGEAYAQGPPPSEQQATSSHIYIHVYTYIYRKDTHQMTIRMSRVDCCPKVQQGPIRLAFRRVFAHDHRHTAGESLKWPGHAKNKASLLPSKIKETKQ